MTDEKTSENTKVEEKPKKKRRSKLRDEIDALKEENGKLKDQLLRKLAEFDNYRKRTAKDIARIIDTASEEMIVKLLPVLNDLERSLEQPVTDENSDSFRKGVEMIMANLHKILQEKGVRVMETNGAEFNPELHEAMMQMESEEVPSNHIIQTFEKGYYLKDRVIKYAKVTVSK